MFIKICGICSPEALLAAFEAGAQAAGFVAYPKSPRYASPEQIDRILRKAPCPGLLKVAVFVNPSLDDIRKCLDAGIDAVQLHGDETADFAAKAATLAKVWKAFAPRCEKDVERISAFPADAFLLDATTPSARGGTGSLADWSLAQKAVKALSKPLMLAGGLSAANVAEAIRTVKPFGVDASSSLETAPGVKSPSLIRDFVAAAKNA